jgi:hypothetical protein
MNRILLVDLGERELKKRQELRARRQALETIRDTKDTSGGLTVAQTDELAQIIAALSSDAAIDKFYQKVAATYRQTDWTSLLQSGDGLVHEYGLLGSQLAAGAAGARLNDEEREIAAICGLLQVDSYTDVLRSDFVDRISVAQGEYRRNRKLFDAGFEQLAGKYTVTLQSQIDAGLIDRQIVGCITPDGSPQDRSGSTDEQVVRAQAQAALRDAGARADAAAQEEMRAIKAEGDAKGAKKDADKDVTEKEASLHGATEAEKKKINAALKTLRATAKAAGTAVSAASRARAAATLASAAAAKVVKKAQADAADSAIAAAIKAVKATFSPTEDNDVCALSGRNVAAVVRRLAANGVNANDAWLTSRVQNAYDMQTGVVDGAAPSSMEIALPDLDDATDVEIIKENLNAVQAIYFAYMLEEARLPQVVERIVELFRGGLLPLGRGKAGDYLYHYYKTASERITEGERRDLYMRAFGAPGGDSANNQPNREFNELWLRFVSAVSSFGRQLTVDRMFRTNVPVSVSQEQVRKAARDLGASLSRCGYGIAYFAATELQKTIMEFRDLLSDPEVRGAFGARDMWQVIDQVNANYLGGARNTNRYRTQARAGAVIIRWIANNNQRITGRFGEVISVSALTNPQLRGSDQPTVSPNDWDLLQACEQWLAVGGVQENSVEQYAQPVESPVITSRPTDMIPQVARDVLDQAGISLPAM